ncbi:MAG: hypothetical protein MK066_07650, partial [Crocinitomicaceae bacterium]|nr:hypothetical protein [Crocinitomicaceae bacterium]
FQSFTLAGLKSDSLLRRYCSSMASFKPEKSVDIDFFDEFLAEVVKVLDDLKIKYLLDYSVASISVDILIDKEGVYKAIDLIGFPGQFYDSINLNQYMLLNRAGISVFPLPYTYWFFDKESVKKELLDFLKK